MSRSRRELDRLSAEAWGDLAGHVRRVRERLGRLAATGAKKHPVLVFGAGAVLAALAFWRWRRSGPPPATAPRAPRERRGFSKLLSQSAWAWLARELSAASEREAGNSTDAAASNGRAHR